MLQPALRFSSVHSGFSLSMQSAVCSAQHSLRIQTNKRTNAFLLVYHTVFLFASHHRYASVKYTGLTYDQTGLRFF